MAKFIFSVIGLVILTTVLCDGANKIVESFHVRSDIRYRFATTQMSSVVRNVDNEAKEIGFDVTLPKEAFIMAFHMTIDGKRYDGQVKERLQAKREYQAAVDRGQSAGHVRQAPRHANVFEVSVNVAAGSAVNFTLTYQEMLRRRFGIYEHEIHVNPGQPVEDFVIEVQIRENRALKFVRTPALKTDYILTNELGEAEEENELTIVDRPNPETATVLYKPSVSQQGDDGQGISARFIVQYDVEHGGKGGDVLVVDGYFVHFVAPDNLAHTLPKNIVFVLDVSGSMYGEKIQQLKEAMATILSDLKPNDLFNIITFSSITTRWKDGLVHASETNIATATSYVHDMRAAGLTNINDALLIALSEMKGRQNKDRVGMIFFLTDGHPTEGEQDPTRIARNIVNANERTAAIYSLAFGRGADYESLKSLSAQNLGFARKIYEASDADLQVSSLYNEISAVSIKDLSVKYQKSTVDEFSLTQTDFPIVFNGSEIVICGFLHSEAETFKYDITGTESKGELEISEELDDLEVIIISPDEVKNQLFTGPRDFSGLVERMWAYKSIKQLLKEKEKFADEASKLISLNKKILEMSLKYKLVTPLTSMVVTKPDQEETSVREVDVDTERRDHPSSSRRRLYSPKGRSSIWGSRARLNYASSSNNNFHSNGLAQSHPSFSGVRYFMPPLSDDDLLLGAPPPPFGSGPNILPQKRTTSIPTPAPTTKTTRSSTPTSKVSTTKLPSKPSTTSPRYAEPVTSSFLGLVTLSARGSTSDPPSICMIPRRWTYGSIVLLAEPNETKVVLKQCKRRRCPQKPALEGLRFESPSGDTEIKLNGSRTWLYSASSTFAVSVLSDTELRVSGAGLNTTIERTQESKTAIYRIRLQVDRTGLYSGLMGDLIARSKAQLNRLSKRANRKAKKTCSAEKTDFTVMIFNKKARRFSVFRSLQSRRLTA